MPKCNITKKSNHRCERCAFYKVEKSVRDCKSNNMCLLCNESRKYYNTCDSFQWAYRYLKTNNDFMDCDNVIVCKRCGRPLTDSESIARHFGLHCYNKRVKRIVSLGKRLF